MAVRERLTLAEGLLASLQSDPTVSALENARALLASTNGDVKLRLGFGGRDRPKREEAREVRALLEAEIARLREAEGIPSPNLPGAMPGTKGAPGGVPKVKGKARGGKGTAKVTDPNDPGFEKLHPRKPKGRVGGGEFAQKGDGVGGQPDPNVAQLQQRLSQLGFKVAQDGQFAGYTEQAVKSFQEKYGLEPTGKVDRATLETLRNPPQKTAAQAQQEVADMENPPKKTAGGTARAASTSGGAGGSASPGRGQSGGSLDVKDPEAVKAFQRSKGLKEDGIVGPDTKKAMGDSGTKTTEQAKREGARSGAGSKSKSSLGGDSLHKGRGMGEKSDAATKDLQKILDTLGYGVGEAGTDGRFGPDTEKAVKRLQRRYGLKADGIVGRQTKALLQRLAKRHAKNVKNADPLKLATEDSGPQAAEDAKWARAQARKEASKDKKKVQEAAAPVRLRLPLQEDTGDAGTDGYDYAWTQTAGGGIPPTDVDLPSYEIADSFPSASVTADVQIVDHGLVDVLGRLHAARERVTEAVALRVTAATGSEHARFLARERVLRERLAEVEAEARAAGVEEGAYLESLHPRDRLGRWREVFGTAKRMHVGDRPESIGGYRVAKLSDSSGNQFAVVGPDGRARHAANPAEVADIVTNTTADNPDVVASRERIERQRYGRVLTHHVPTMGVDATSLPLDFPAGRFGPEPTVHGPWHDSRAKAHSAFVVTVSSTDGQVVEHHRFPDQGRAQGFVDDLRRKTPGARINPPRVPTMGTDARVPTRSVRLGRMRDDTGHKPDDYFDMSDPRTVRIPTALLTLSKPPESQPKSVANAERLMDSAVRGGTAKRKPISVRRNPDGTYTVLDGNATSGVALKREWPYIPAILED